MKIATILAGLALAGAATTASAEVVSTNETGFTSRSVVVLEEATRAEAFAALGRWAEWWSPDHTYSGDNANLSLTIEPGGCLCEVWDGGRIEHARVLLVIPEQGMLRMNAPFGPLQSLPVTAILTHTIRERDEGGVEVIQTLVVGGDASAVAMAPGVDAVMSEGLSRFERFAETGSAD